MSTQDIVVPCKMIARRLQEAREKRGWTQSKLGQRAGVLPRSISYWEKGRGEPSISAAIKLAIALNLTLDELFRHAEGNKP